MSSDADLLRLSTPELQALRATLAAAGGEVGVAKIDALLAARSAIVRAEAGATSADPAPLGTQRVRVKTAKEIRDEFGDLRVQAPRKREPNKWEALWMAEQKARYPDAEVRFESIKLRLASGAWYKADVFVVWPDGRIEVHEVKGHWREAARVRIKLAAEQYPWWTFRAVQKLRKKQGGGWKVETFEGKE